MGEKKLPHFSEKAKGEKVAQTRSKCQTEKIQHSHTKRGSVALHEVLLVKPMSLESQVACNIRPKARNELTAGQI
jgi:hypothetical protein